MSSLLDDSQCIKSSYDDNGNLRVSQAALSFQNDQKTVTTAGTPVQITASATPIKRCIVRALAANTGKIYIGSSSVQAGSSHGYQLNASESIILDICDLSQLWINSSVNGEGISYLAY